MATTAGFHPANEGSIPSIPSMTIEPLTYNEAIRKWAVAKILDGLDSTQDTQDSILFEEFSFQFNPGGEYQLGDYTWDYQNSSISFQWRWDKTQTWQTYYEEIELGQLIRELTE